MMNITLKISEQKKNIPALALKWKDTGEIDENVFNEIVMLVSMATFRDWRPFHLRNSRCQQ